VNKAVKAALAAVIVALMAAMAVAMAGCEYGTGYGYGAEYGNGAAYGYRTAYGYSGGDDPQSLAKQSMALIEENLTLLALGLADDDPEAAALKKKLDALQQKVDALPAAEQETFMAELLESIVTYQ
jgi:hypothetical protein